MFSKLLVLFSASTTFAAINDNMADTRYFVTLFNGGEFPMSIGTCNPFSVLGAPYQMATCTDATNLLWTLYSDDDCTTQIEQYKYNGTTQSGLGNFLDYDCTIGKGDEYTTVEFSVGGCDTNTKVIMNAAISTCAQNTDAGNGVLTPDEYRSISVYCDSTIAELQYYDNPNTQFASCTSDNFYQVRNATTTCGYMLTASDSDVYGKLIDCTVDPVGDGDSASRLSIFCNIFGVFLAILTLFW